MEQLKKRMLHWANQRDILLFLDNNQYHQSIGRYECLLGLGVVAQFTHPEASFEALRQHNRIEQDWLLGHLNYDFKNQLEALSSSHIDHLQFPDLHFFRPEIVCYIKKGAKELVIESLSEDPKYIWQAICNFPIGDQSRQPHTEIRLQKRIPQKQYCEIINLLKEHIRQGDCYEINFCNEAFCTSALIQPLSVFHRLNGLSPAPFAAYYKLQDRYLLSASPERYLFKEGSKVWAQPIKGTAARKVGQMQDEQAMRELYHSIKDRAENVMIVDLMRNDLARFCRVDSVRVEELYGIYTFPQVHQMISTVSGFMRSDADVFDALKYTFPMGSMTGAPKVMVMQLIEQYEMSRRSLFSGTVGYINPNGDIDFNVVIRSLFYNQSTKYLSYQTGGAITYDSVPELEWEETCLKAAAIERVLKG